MLSFLTAPLPSLLLAALLPHSVLSDTDDNTAAGVFVYPTNSGPDFVVALNAVDNGDLYFHMSGPASYSWLALGIGEDMADSLMFIVHSGDDDNSLTLSPRVAFDGESEPTYYPAVHCEQLAVADASNSQSEMAIDAVCHNATSWAGGSLDLSSTGQEFMFAFGPKQGFHSDSLSAPMVRHELYGNFKMDMTKATSQETGAVPQPNGPNARYVGLYTSDAEDVTSDDDKASTIHGVVMCIAYIVLYPLGALLLRLAKKVPVRLHWICQSIASILVLVGFGLGVAASKEYNRSRDFANAHQVIGIILLIAVIAQLTLGSVHHVIFKKKQKSTVLGKIHMVVGPLIIFLAMINGGLGLDLAMASTSSIIAYSVIIALLAVALIGIRAWIHFRGGRPTKVGRARGDSDDMSLNGR